MSVSELSVPMRGALTGRLLADATVVLTGAAGGIGRSIAEALTLAGAQVIAVDRPGSALQEAVEGLSGAGNEPVTAELDVATPGGLDSVLESVDQVDGLINCAGLWSPSPFEEIDEHALSETIQGNLLTAFHACHTVLPRMKNAKAGSIVNFASTAGEYGSISPAAHYAAAKAGVIGLTKSLAREAAPFDVRVNAVSPGPTDTVALGAATPEARAAAGARTLFGRLGRPEEIAGACVFLLSPLSSFVTGHVLRVNGGALL